MNSDLALSMEIVTAATKQASEARSSHMAALITQHSKLQQQSDKELRQWKALYQLNNDACEYGLDLINALVTAENGVDTEDAQNMARTAMCDVEVAIGVAAGELNDIGDNEQLPWSPDLIQLGMQAQERQEHAQNLQTKMSQLLTESSMSDFDYIQPSMP